MDLGEYAEAETLYGYALSILEAQTYASADEAVTFLNMADLVNAGDGAEAGESLIQEYLTEAEELLESEMLPRDGYYAFVCEKCAPVFGYYGRFLTNENFNELYGRQTVIEREKSCLIEEISSDIIGKLKDQGLTGTVCGDLEKYAYSVNDHIENGEIRNMHILTAI